METIRPAHQATSEGKGSRGPVARLWRGSGFGRGAVLAHARPPLQEFEFSACEATVVDELIADRAARPSASEQGLVTIEALLADPAAARFDAQQERLPVAAGHSNTHGAQYSQPPVRMTSVTHPTMASRTHQSRRAQDVPCYGSRGNALTCQSCLTGVPLPVTLARVADETSTGDGCPARPAG